MSARPSSESKSSGIFSIAYEKDVKAIKVRCQGDVHSLAFLADGKHVVGGGHDGKIRHWRAEDGKEAGAPMNAKSPIYSIAVSRDGRWIVSGTSSGLITVWDAKSHDNAIEFAGHTKAVDAVDISPDGTKVASGSADEIACVWSLSTGQRLLGPWKHMGALAGVKFSSEGHIATATHARESVRIYDGQTGHLLIEVPIKVYAQSNQSLSWSFDSKTLFSLSDDGYLHSLDLSTSKGPSGWQVHSGTIPRCIALSSNGKFIAVSDGSLVSFWDHTTQKRIGYFIRHKAHIHCMAISPNFDLAMAGGEKITVCGLSDILPSRYVDIISTEHPTQDKADPEEIIQSLHKKISRLEVTVQKLRDEPVTYQRAATRDEDETIKNSNNGITDLEEANQKLTAQLADSRRESDSLVQILRVHERKHQCEALYAEGRIGEALASVFGISTALSEEIRANKLIMEWLSEFSQRCIETLEKGGDRASNTVKQNGEVVPSVERLEESGVERCQERKEEW